MRCLDDRGTITALIAVLSVFFFAMALMVAEGGRKLGNISRAQDVASEAARAAAATLDVDSIASGGPRIDTNADRAKAQAELIITGAGAEVELVDFRIDLGATNVFVRVRVDGASVFPGFDISGTGSHTAQVIDPSLE